MASERLHTTREQWNTIERLSLTHGNAELFRYRAGRIGVVVLAKFADGHACNIDEDGR